MFHKKNYFIEYLAIVLGNYFTRETGVQIEFDSATIPRLSEGSIQFRDVIASRNSTDFPEHETTLNQHQNNEFELSIRSIDVKLSLMRLLEGQ